ncbi:TonB-dependent receptor plug domain-containing protein [Phaeocystidibacter luteus]|uniref:TonB-dependent receptor n=1 Tax=Phaeocystidibacter luteus TaxID=911197 RepID=A0A6N6RH63_9FLAO|nr:TonB-dependent receptor [Phaeocystidibacter luteus]KAB2810092.1 TonB-dependent receptor [Phaeocystidibacter luteus]
MRNVGLLLFILLFSSLAHAQVATKVTVVLDNQPLPGVELTCGEAKAATNVEGEATLMLQQADTLHVKAFGIHPVSIYLKPGDDITIEAEAQNTRQFLDQVVVTTTRKHLDRRESPIAVQVMNRELLQATQSISVAEGLNFRPGLRMEYNCQNCGFSQVRLNGLDGPYTQVLIDGRPIFSALSGVYGLEQLPSSMIERVEVVRGGGSSMYGANAIAGTINLITREPLADEWEVKAQTTLNGGVAPDYIVQGHSSWVTEKSGVQVWTSLRSREPFNANPDDLYDRNGDGIAETKDDFSEITKLRSASVGGRYWYRPNSRERYQIEGRGLYEFRRGGNRFDYEPHEADIAEQLIHRVGGFNGQYEWISSDGLSYLTVYGAANFTQRDSYYGAGGNSPDPAERERALLYYGDTRDQIVNAGAFYGWGLNEHHTLLAGIDYQYNHVNDIMPGYNRNIDQAVSTPAVYAQWQWKINDKWTSQVGARYDRPTIQSVNAFAGEPAYVGTDSYDAINPRFSLLYKVSSHMRVRGSVATGFRAPQAFDEDLHISTLGGAARIVQLDPNLDVERSISYNLGVEWDYHLNRWEGRISIDGFYTDLMNPFVNQPFTGAIVDNGDTIAILDTKVNDPNGATVAGANIETEWAQTNWTLQLGWTLQMATYAEAREWYEGWASNRILRAPQNYGYAIVAYIPNERWRVDMSTTVTGSMVTPNERLGILVETPWFVDGNLSVQRTWEIKNAHLTLEAGVYNVLDMYQSDVEIGWERDASYFYGPIRPRSYYLSLTYGL